MSYASSIAVTLRPDAPTLRDTAAGLSVRVGIVLLALIVFINDAVFRRTEDISHGMDFQVALKMAISGCCGLYGLFHLRQSAVKLTEWAGILAAFFGIWTAIIVPFAVDITYAAGACVSLWCVILFAAALISELTPRQIILTAMVSLIAYVAASWVVYYANPELGREEQMVTGGEIIERIGGLNHPNGLGRQCALLIVVILTAGIQRYLPWRVLVLPILFAGVTLVLTDSRTALLAACAVVGVALIRTMRRSTLALITFVGVPLAAAALAVAVLAGVVNFQVDTMLADASRNGDAEEIYSLTGRTLVWDFALKNFAKSPWLGCGFGCSRFVMEKNFFPTHHAHNLMLNVLLSTGLIGGLLLLAQMLALASRSFTIRNPFPVLLLTTVFVGGMADYVMLGPVPESHAVMWLLALFWPVNEVVRSTSRPRLEEGVA